MSDANPQPNSGSAPKGWAGSPSTSAPLPSATELDILVVIDDCVMAPDRRIVEQVLAKTDLFHAVARLMTLGLVSATPYPKARGHFRMALSLTPKAERLLVDLPHSIPEYSVSVALDRELRQLWFEDQAMKRFSTTPKGAKIINILSNGEVAEGSIGMMLGGRTGLPEALAELKSSSLARSFIGSRRVPHWELLKAGVRLSRSLDSLRAESRTVELWRHELIRPLASGAGEALPWTEVVIGQQSLGDPSPPQQEDSQHSFDGLESDAAQTGQRNEEQKTATQRRPERVVDAAEWLFQHNFGISAREAFVILKLRAGSASVLALKARAPRLKYDWHALVISARDHQLIDTDAEARRGDDVDWYLTDKGIQLCELMEDSIKQTGLDQLDVTMNPQGTTLA